MTDDFDPGEGWREEKVRSLAELRVGDVVTRADSEERWPLVQRREKPVPPLPTEYENLGAPQTWDLEEPL